MATYVNDLRLKEIGTGESSGTWGTETNTNLELIGEALGFGTEAITTNADTHTTTVADGSTDPGRAMYLKYTGTLDSACTITIAPNTMSRMHFIENGTSGSQNIIISQGTGANVTIPAGDTKAVYLDGAGSGAAVADAFASLNTVDLKVEDDLTVTDDATIGGTLGVTGVLTANAGVVVDNITIDGTEIDLSSGTLTFDVANNIELDADGGQVIFMDGGTNIGRLENSSSDFVIKSMADDKDIIFKGEDGGSGITALTLDMSDAGTAAFNAGATFANDVTITSAGPAISLVDSDNNPDYQIKNGNGSLRFIDTTNTVDLATFTAGEVAINEGSADVDFRVESNGNANMLFVDGGNDVVTIGGATGETADTFSVTEAGANSVNTRFVNTNADANGVKLILQKNSSSPADNDELAEISFFGQDDGGNANVYAGIQVFADDVTNGTEDGILTLSTLVAGTYTENMRIGPAGFVNIGATSNAHETLHVTGPSGNAILLHMDADTADGTSSLLFKNDSTNTDVRIKAGIIYQRDDPGTRGTGDLHLCVNGVNSDTNVSVSDAKVSLFASGLVTIGNLNFTGTGSDSLITAGNVIFNVSGGILTSGSSSLDLQFQVPVTGVGTSTAAKLDAPSGDWFTNDGSVSSLSDSRLKKDITTLTDGIDIVKQLRPVTFKYDDTTRDEDGSKQLGAASETVRYGFVAQEVESVASQYVASREGKVKGETVSDLKSLSQTRMIPMLVKSIQELESRITTLEG